jgi:hypothetical protein
MFDVTSEGANFWFDAFNVMLFVGAFAVALGTYGSIKMGAIKERFSEERTAGLETQTAQANAALGTAQADIAKANARIAEASARQKEAELRVEQLRKELGPRQLQRDAFIKELTGQPTANVEIMYLQDDPECFVLAQQIGIALKDAGWPSVAPKPIPSLILSDGPTSMSVDGQPSGVTVVVSGITQEEADASQNAMLGRDWIKTPWTVLMRAVAAGIGKAGGHAGGPNAPPKGTLRVVVAPRL